MGEKDSKREREREIGKNRESETGKERERLGKNEIRSERDWESDRKTYW